MSRVVLAMSGGVDSSVAAQLLLEGGHEVIGVFMRHGEQSPVACSTECHSMASSSTNSPAKSPPVTLPIVQPRLDHKQGCCSAADAEDARRVADRLRIPFYALNLEEEFGRIMDYFVDEYTRGRTPNPCVMCNNWIKFGKLFDYADSVDATYVATGHYAQLSSSDDDISEIELHRGTDPRKDQSYVLFGIDRKLLQRMLLPVGGYQKAWIRERASQLGLDVAQKRDSQEICFVTTGKHDQFIRQRRQDVDTSGDIVTTDGQVVGQHEGIERFTIGQRKGLGIAFGEPRFVVRIDSETRQIIIGRETDLSCSELWADNTNWLADVPGEQFECTVQVRYNSQAQAATVQRMPEDRLHVSFLQPCKGIAPGQAVVCFEGNRVLGGGWITKTR